MVICANRFRTLTFYQPYRSLGLGPGSVKESAKIYPYPFYAMMQNEEGSESRSSIHVSV